MLICHPYTFFGEVSFAHFLKIEWFISLLSYKNSSYSPDTSPLSDVCFENIFSQSVALSSHSHNGGFGGAGALHADEAQLIHVFS